MKMELTLLGVASVFGLLMLTGCTRLFFAPERKTPEDIYLYEDQHHPGSTWVYLGSKRRWHYFSPSNPFDIQADWKIPRHLVPDLQSYPYHFDGKKRKATSADVEIHQDYIRIHIDGEKPIRIPFKSKGFLTVERRQEIKKRHRERVEHFGDDRFGVDSAKKVPSAHPKAVRAVITSDGTISIEKGNGKTDP